MFISSGKPANNLRIGSELINSITVYNVRRLFNQWNTPFISTIKPTFHAQGFPLLNLSNHPCLNIFFTQFPQCLLLSPRINKKRIIISNMKVSIAQEKLAKALNLIKDVASSRNELAILNNILLRTDGGRLLIAGTNLEIASTQYVGAKIDQPGSITIPARLVSEFIANLPSGTVELETKDSHLNITSGKFSSVINGVIADEYPELPTVDETAAIRYEITAGDLKKAINQTKIAVSSDTTRAVLTGIYWQTHEGYLYLAATDGYRLAEKKMMKSDSELKAIIPASTLAEVGKSADDEEQLTILFDDTQVCFRTDNMEIVSRLIDGKFPDYKQLIPATSDIEIKIKKADFSRITKIAALFARESGGGITLTASKDKSLLSIHSIASELGENTSEAAAEISADGQITLNSRYLTEVLNVIDDDDIVFSFNGKLSPCVIREQVKNSDYTHIIMPLKS